MKMSFNDVIQVFAVTRQMYPDGFYDHDKVSPDLKLTRHHCSNYAEN